MADLDNFDDPFLEGETNQEGLNPPSERDDAPESTPPVNVYPDAEVRVERAQYATSHLRTLVEGRKQIIIDPGFQRKQVWSVSQSSELVESILMGIPIPTIYLFEMPNGTRQVVDGRQRISAILDFLNDRYMLRDLKILENLNGKRFSALDPKLQGIFEDYQLFFYIIQPPTPERVKFDIFDRVNRGGTRLTKQEMRNALYMGKSTEMLKALSASEAFLSATGKGVSPKRAKDKYIILRSIAFILLKRYPEKFTAPNSQPIEYKSDMDDFLARTMDFINNRADDRQIQALKEDFMTAMKLASNLMGADAFRFNSTSTGAKRPINLPFFEIMVYILSDPAASIVSSEKLLGEINNLKGRYDHQPMFSNNPDSSTNVNARFEIADTLLSQILL